MSELTSEALATALIAWARTREWTDDSEPPVFRFERWIRETPERGWEVLQALVDREPLDPEVMDLAAYRVPQLLRRDFPGYRDRVAGLFAKSRCLDRLLDPDVLVEQAYGPRYSEPEQLAPIWLRYAQALDRPRNPDERGPDEPHVALQIALEVIARGPSFGLDTDDVSGPLLDVLRHFGARVIDDIEAAANRSLGVRRAIWNVRRRNWSDGVTRAVPDGLWSRFQAAAAGTTTCNTDPPPGEAHPLEAALEDRVSAWFERHRAWWACDEIFDLHRSSPDDAWRAVVAITRATQSPEDLAFCGAGHLEDLIREHPDRFIDRAEALAASEASFRGALGAAWLTLKDVPEPLALRYYIASGRQLRVLDAPEGWPEDASLGD